MYRLAPNTWMVLMASKSGLRLVGSGSGRRTLRILIADDDRDTATTLAVILRDEDHEVNTVLRGDEVLEACRLMRPDVVIVDINMPGMSGFAVARELRQRHGPLAPLLIAISGVWTKTADRQLGEAIGFDHYVLKPCDPRELLPLLEPRREGAEENGEGAC
jgi:two-component system, OmpR family, response regulator